VATTATSTTTATATTAGPSVTTGTTATSTTGSLAAPAATVEQDTQYVADVGEVDPALATYEQKFGNVALRAVLTDGSAFCAFLARDGAIDEALVAVAQGADGDESQTHLPLSVTTFNAVEAVALLTLCPSEQKLIPAADRSRITSLGRSLAGRSG
jgi:hypothetical protein